MNLYELYPTIEVPTYLNPDTICQLQEQWNVINQQKSRVILLKGQPGVFCLGLDLDWVAKQTVSRHQIETFTSFLKGIMSSSSITIAVVNGAVTGGGLGISSACDFVVASEQSTFRLTEGMLGLVPGIILHPLLNRLNRQTIKRMVFSAQEYRIEGAIELGLVDEMVLEEELDAQVARLIKQMCTSKKQSVQDLKMLLGKALDPGIDLIKEGTELLQHRLANQGMKRRLNCIANLMNAITFKNEEGISTSQIH